MKQNQSRKFKLLYFQQQFSQSDSKAIPVVGLGKEQISANNYIGINLAQSYKSGWVMMMLCTEVVEEQLREILSQYLTEEEQEKIIFRREEELFDQFDIFKHLVKDQYLAVLPRGQIVQFIKEEKIGKVSIEEAQQIIDKHLTFLELDQQGKEFHQVRILNQVKEQINSELPKLEYTPQIKQFSSIQERVEYENEMKLYKGKGLFEIPKFDKSLIHYNWDNMQQIPRQLLNSQ